jgi:hypothetical protein
MRASSLPTPVPLRIARCTEPFALLVARLAYEREGDPELAYRFERFTMQQPLV